MRVKMLQESFSETVTKGTAPYTQPQVNLYPYIFKLCQETNYQNKTI